MRLLLVSLAFLCLVAPVEGHDYWLEPEAYFTEVGRRIAVRLHVGDHFQSEAERPFQKKPTRAFQLIGGGETIDLIGQGEEDKRPVARITPRKSGTYLLRMDRGPHYITIKADRFNKYLAEEGLSAVLEMRRRSGEDRKDGRERYSRCLKALWQVGPTPDDACKRALGQTLEIVPEANPYRLRPGDTLTVRLLFEGKPLARAKLFAHCRSRDQVTTRTCLTSDKGLASFQLDRGVWLLRVVHMRRCKGDPAADWESFWAACTFAVR
jgi:uncharacterized GH25 family protein